jgi:hypothetical protein
MAISASLAGSRTSLLGHQIDLRVSGFGAVTRTE